jgi:hypothetical protein
MNAGDPKKPEKQPSEAKAATPPPRPVANLFEMQAKPLDRSVSPLGRVRSPRRRTRLWCAAAAIGLGAFLAGANAETNSTDAPTLTNALDLGTNLVVTNTPGTNVVSPDSMGGTVSTNAPKEDRGANRDRKRDRAERNATNDTARRSSKPDYSSFKIVTDRNIFDPNRNPRRPNNDAPRPRPKVIDSLALVGVMSYEKGTFAFFDGTRGEFKKALKASDSIGGLKLSAIDASAVKLTKGEQTLDLRIGMQLKREDEGEWQLSGAAESFSSSRSSSGGPDRGSFSSSRPGSSSSSPSQTSPSDAPSTGGDNDVLRRLMQRREQE